ncbi:MAG: 50S ribosomal protein L25 [Elusimicrobiota bacterium]
MSDAVKLKADERKVFKKSRLNKLRSKGEIPAVLYGPDVENTSIIIEEKDFKEAISTEHGENVLIDLKIGEADPVTTIIKEIQVHPVTVKIIHVDLCQIKLTEKVVREIPLEVEGEAKGVKEEGGVLEQIVRKVKVSCLPTDIPNKFVLDVSELGIGDGMEVGDIDTREGIEVLTSLDALAVNVVPPSEVAEPEEEELEEMAEPKVIGEEEEEEAAGEEAPEAEEEPAEEPEPEKE